ncbi:trypsin-like peptidase domain-containing protein [Aneurinibacillus sp. Ricciae_BoGa-3]|uniref:S1C family serine protease n=1 Tax=Aneurinibacillus sp. Ricciae_BoGa-3 TaxID=3022697 RepID=UPI00234016C6|nr:trypsin-like peptidase domain-containing protein [Aneurinibacillus sp. Ricciae_BoGa-3]WCK56520.1 trypsin-like peptidase domain-containing protein [Aneurinibacillus sp. Ricciae_BoGa-3]
MGFYNDQQSKEPTSKGLKIWAASVVLSALVGSASTAVIMKSNLIVPQQVAPVAGSDTTPSSVPVTNVSVKVNDGVVGAVKAVKPAIVGVVNYAAAPSDYMNQSQGLQAQGEGSGIIFDKQGYIVTNNHVVEGAAKVEVLLPDGKKTKADVIGTDPYSDLAVLKIPVSYVTGVASLGNSDELQAGEPAIAIGNPLGEAFNQTVTEGIISATKRMMPVTDQASGQTLNQQAVIQTDAAINPGNSGGALCNIQGQIIGINSSKIASNGVEGMGFAIPINEARQIISSLLRTGHVNYPALGIGVSDLQQQDPGQYVLNVPVDYGVVVTGVQSAEAKQSGLKTGDVIVALNGTKITDSVALHSELFKHKIGDTVTITIYRGNDEQQTLSVKLTALSSYANTGNNSADSNQNGNVNGLWP